MQANYELFSGRTRSAIKPLAQISIWSGKAFAWLIIPMVLCLVYEVFARYLFNAPTLWAYDMTYMLYGTHFMLGAAYTLAMQGHIRTDFFYRLWPVRWQGTLDSFLYIFSFFRPWRSGFGPGTTMPPFRGGGAKSRFQAHGSRSSILSRPSCR